MTVYVDNFRAEYRPPLRKPRKYVMCHMMADTDDELHQMADRIGVARLHFQVDHYDICLAKRALAINAGAVEVSTRQLVELRRNRRAQK